MNPSDPLSQREGVRVKICGITTVDDALAAASAGADYLGYVFFEGSKRFIRPNTAAPIIERVRCTYPLVRHVGLLVNPTPDAAVEALKQAGADHAQLHGDCLSEVAAAIRSDLPSVRMITAFRFGPGAPPARWEEADTDFFLCDTFDPKQHGGTGRPFDPGLIPSAMPRERLFLAGGLTPETVADAVRFVRPFAVDVSSGVESAPGKKSEVLVSRFIAAARRAV
ncbi:MAG: phosphoribosylanthranilate isomerase [Candidatus Sumerlaeaceae bacterium]|nr:phosphoribosylanthranilate isomerase [Candidatus Sumerlaeaceae bacterium]